MAPPAANTLLLARLPSHWVCFWQETGRHHLHNRVCLLSWSLQKVAALFWFSFPLSPVNSPLSHPPLTGRITSFISLRFCGLQFLSAIYASTFQLMLPFWLPLPLHVRESLGMGLYGLGRGRMPALGGEESIHVYMEGRKLMGWKSLNPLGPVSVTYI